MSCFIFKISNAQIPMPNKIPSPNDQLSRLGFWILGFDWSLDIGI
jgi:hypothetical protein